MPAFAFQCFLIGCASVQWEPDHIIATGPARPLRVCCQLILVAVPFLLSGVLAYLSGALPPIPP